MANRSYLYSCDVLPELRKNEEIVGIGEWNYNVPLTFKLLLSGGSSECKSLIWDNEEKIAIIGDYEQGLKNLNIFFDKLDIEEAKPFIEETILFFSKPEITKKYFILEGAELFDMWDEDIYSQNIELLREIRNITETAFSSEELEDIQELKDEKKKQERFGFLGKYIFRDEIITDQDIVNCTSKIGFGNWSDILYFDLSKP